MNHVLRVKEKFKYDEPETVVQSQRHAQGPFGGDPPDQIFDKLCNLFKGQVVPHPLLVY
jgi:hypothetical protein